MAKGVLSGLGDLAGAIKDKVTGALSAGWHAAGKLLHGSGEFMFTKHVAGKPMAEGVIEGFLLGITNLPSKISEKLRSSLETAKQAIDAARGTFKSAMGLLADDGVKVFEAKTSKMLDNLARKFDRMKDRVDKSLSAKLAGIDAWEQQLTGAEAALKSLQDQHDSEGRAQDISDAQAALAAAQKDGDADSIKQAQRQLNEALYADKVAAMQATADAERAARAQQADAQRAAAQAEADLEKQRLDAEYEQQRTQLQAQRDLQERHLKERLDALQTFLDSHPTMWSAANAQLMKLLASFGVNYKISGSLLGTAFVTGLKEDMGKVSTTAKKVTAAMVKQLDAVGEQMHASGKTLGAMFAAGIRSQADEVRAAATALADAAARPLQLHSPAKEGPLSTLDKWWAPFAPTLLKGFDTGGIGRAVSSALTPAAPGGGFGLALAGAGGSGAVTVVEKHVHLHGGTFIGTDELQAGRDLKRLIEQAA
jgi:hypothetical protein